MKENLVLRWVAGICLLAITVVAFASDRVEPNSFLSKKAESVSQLIGEINSNEAVADRYERHFGKTKDEIVQYFGTLHMAKLNADGAYKIYSVDDQGLIKAHAQRLKAGTKVFADASGIPVLKASCGNAMVTGSNGQSTEVSPNVSGSTEALKGLGNAGTDTTTAAALETKGSITSPTTPIAVLPDMSGVPGQVSTGDSNQGISAGGSAIPYLLGLGGAGALLFGHSGGGTPVPEPATLLVMGSALAALRYRRKNK